MADPEHVAVVKQGAEAINTWRAQYSLPRLELDQAPLSGVDLSRANLWNTNLVKADLSGANLRGATLRGANLQEADLQTAKEITRVQLLQAWNAMLAFYSPALLTDLKLPPDHNQRLSDRVLVIYDLSGANLVDANLNWVSLAGANLSGAHLQGANLSESDLAEANLSGANLYQANLSRCRLIWTNIHGADLSEACLNETNLRELRGAYWAEGLETTRFTPLTSSDPINNALYFETCARSWAEKWLDWERLRVMGRLPLFGASYITLILIPIIFYSLALYNDQVELVRAWAEQIIAQPDHILHGLASLVRVRFHPHPIPRQSLLLLVSTVLLAMGSTLYTFFCPSRIKEFSRDQWCDQLGHSLLHYWPFAWRYRYIRLVCTLCYTLGGAGALWVIGTKVWRVLLFIIKNSPYPSP